MFRPKLPLYLKKIEPNVEVTDGETRKILVLDWQSEPFPSDIAEELGIRKHLFSVTTGEPLSDLIDTKLSIKVPKLVMVTFHAAPDATESRVQLRNVQIAKQISVRKDKETPTLSAILSFSVRYPSADEILYLLNGYREQHFLTFEVEQGDMLTDGEEAPAPRRGRGRPRKERPEGEQPLPGTEAPATPAAEDAGGAGAVN